MSEVERTMEHMIKDLNAASSIVKTFKGDVIYLGPTEHPKSSNSENVSKLNIVDGKWRPRYPK
ncbi:MAG: hypothetical protein ABIE55_00170 [Candidatus Aenigmatarchaeota archaeon]